MRSFARIAVALLLVGGAGYAVHRLTTSEPKGPAGGGDDAADSGDPAAIDAMLAGARDLGRGPYRPEAVRMLVARAGVALDAQQADVVLPALHDHLTALRSNLEDARDAAEAGRPAGERVRYHVFAAQAHGAFQKRLRELVPPETARALFDAFPPMVPPNPAIEARR
jgi:hypothetical protein